MPSVEMKKAVARRHLPKASGKYFGGAGTPLFTMEKKLKF
jgi:hypothetical protein